MAVSKSDFENLKKELDELKDKQLTKKVLPAKSPKVYKQSDGSFINFAAIINNYFRIANVPDSQRSLILLTYLSVDDYERVTQVYSAKDLEKEEFSKVVSLINGILCENITRPTAVSKLMKLKQNDMKMSDFLKKIEYYGSIGFPEPSMQEAKQRCMLSSLQSNCRSKILSYEIHCFIDSETQAKNAEPDFTLVSRKALELDQILTDKNNSDDEIDEKSPSTSIFNVQNSKVNYKTETRRCFNCGIQGHLKATCRKKPMQNYNNQKRNSWYKNNNGKDYSYRHKNDNNYSNPSFKQNQQSSYRNKDHLSQNSDNSGKPVSFVSTYFDQDQPEDLNSKSLQQEGTQDLLL